MSDRKREKLYTIKRNYHPPRQYILSPKRSLEILKLLKITGKPVSNSIADKEVFVNEDVGALRKIHIPLSKHIYIFMF